MTFSPIHPYTPNYQPVGNNHLPTVYLTAQDAAGWEKKYKRPYLSLAVLSPSCHWNPQVWESPSACQSTRVLSLWQPQPVLSCEEINHHNNYPMLTAVYECIIAQKQYHKQSHNNLFDKQLQHHRKSKNVSQKTLVYWKFWFVVGLIRDTATNYYYNSTRANQTNATH